jgi:hypothetical protein
MEHFVSILGMLSLALIYRYKPEVHRNYTWLFLLITVL